MTLPNYDPENDGHVGSVLAFGGVEFLKQVRRSKIEPPVVVITQFETFGDDGNAKDRKELENDLRQNFPSIFKGMVYYHASLSSWTEELNYILDQIEMERAILICGVIDDDTHKRASLKSVIENAAGGRVQIYEEALCLRRGECCASTKLIYLFLILRYLNFTVMSHRQPWN